MGIDMRLFLIKRLDKKKKDLQFNSDIKALENQSLSPCGKM